MPIYTYACAACGAEIERRQSFSDAPLTVCESCGGSLRKVLHPVGVIFKGSGFYNTDYKKSSGNGSAAASDGASKPKESTESVAPGESKKSEPAKAETSTASGKSDSTSKTPAASAKD